MKEGADAGDALPDGIEALAICPAELAIKCNQLQDFPIVEIRLLLGAEGKRRLSRALTRSH